MSFFHIKRENLRKGFGKIKEIVSLPDLIEVQSKSFNDFVQLDYLPNERENIGLESVFKNIFPIEQGDRFSLKYCGYELGDWACICGALSGIEKRYTWKNKTGKKTGVSRLSKADIESGTSYTRCSSCHSRVSLKTSYTVEECVASGKTFAVPLKIKLQLISWDGEGENKQIKDMKEQSVFVCLLPIMVGPYEDVNGEIKVGDKGTFVINGVHRVVVSQIHRAPGVLFSSMKKSKTIGAVSSYNARLIPSRGAWLDFEFDNNGLLYVRIDKKKKILSTTFLQAIGLSRDEIINKFYDVLKVSYQGGEYKLAINDSLSGLRFGTGILANAIDALKSSKLEIRKGSRVTKELIAKIKKAGINSINITRENLIGACVVNRIEHPKSGEVLLDPASVIDQSSLIDIEKSASATIINFEILAETLAGSASALISTLAVDHIYDQTAAIKEVYSKIRPGDAPGQKIMEDYIRSMFFSSRYYNLTPVGRLRINRKLGLGFDLSTTVLTMEDLISTVKYLINLQEKGEGEADDIDDLSNRCVRLVDELLQMQVYLGFSRIEKIAREKLRLIEGNVSCTPYDFINVKPMAAVLGAFFGTGQLSQFMDQTNPLSEMAHKRRLSALGPGGITRERATLDVRDVHPSHYGKICPIETPDGHNIGLISYLSIYSKVNSLGFLETTYRPVKNGVVSDDIVVLDAFQERGKVIAQAAIKIDKNGKIDQDKVLARKDGDYVLISPSEVDFVDVSTRQLVSVATAMIPFLEHDDANRALMGSNMQRQAVPLIAAKAPIVGTGVERDVAGSEGISILAKNSGIVHYVSADKVVVSLRSNGQALEEWALSNIEVYDLQKFGKSSHNTCVNFRPVVKVGDVVERGDLIADGPAVDRGELALGNNLCVAFMPWGGYNFEDAIVVSKKLVSDDLFSSIHIEEFVVEARDTKLGAEEITRDIPNISERELEILDEDGIVKIGTRVSPGDILVAKATLKGDVQVSPEEKLLRAIFGDKSRDVRDTSARMQPGISGTVIDVKVFSRSGVRKDKRYKDYVTKETAKIESVYAIKFDTFVFGLLKEFEAKVASLNVKFNVDKNASFEDVMTKASANENLKKLTAEFTGIYNDRNKIFQAQKKEQIARLRRGDDLPSGVLKSVRVYVAVRRPISVGDKMAGRHGNKGVVSKVVDIQDMPYLADGTPVDIVLNPLGVPSRMNLGQLLETMMGMACMKIGDKAKEQLRSFTKQKAKEFLFQHMGKELVSNLIEKYGEDSVYDLLSMIAKEGLKMATPVFDGADYEKEVIPTLTENGLNETGKYDLYDGRTGEKFHQPVTVGYIYMMKLNHMADDKLHARSVGPYSLITQQPLGGKAKGGGQRLGEMEVWALFGYGAAYTLREMLTIKSDDITGRTKAFDSIVHGEEIGEPGLPESFSVLVKELQSLCLSVDLFQACEERFSE